MNNSGTSERKEKDAEKPNQKLARPIRHHVHVRGSALPPVALVLPPCVAARGRHRTTRRFLFPSLPPFPSLPFPSSPVSPEEKTIPIPLRNLPILGRAGALGATAVAPPPRPATGPLAVTLPDPAPPLVPR